MHSPVLPIYYSERPRRLVHDHLLTYLSHKPFWLAEADEWSHRPFLPSFLVAQFLFQFAISTLEGFVFLDGFHALSPETTLILSCSIVSNPMPFSRISHRSTF